MTKKLSLTILFVVGCGTYSTLRPADTLPKGRVEIQGGIAANEVGEVQPVAQVS